MDKINHADVVQNLFAPEHKEPHKVTYTKDKDPQSAEKPVELPCVKEIKKVCENPSFTEIEVVQKEKGCDHVTIFPGVFTEINVTEGQTITDNTLIGMNLGLLKPQYDLLKTCKFASLHDRAKFLLEVIKKWSGYPVPLFASITLNFDRYNGGIRDFNWKKWHKTYKVENVSANYLSWGKGGVADHIISSIFGPELKNVTNTSRKEVRDEKVFIDNCMTYEFHLRIDKLTAFVENA